MSSVEFVGIVADNPDCKIKLKAFHSEIQNDPAALAQEQSGYNPKPMIQKFSATDIEENYVKIKADIQNLFDMELKKIEIKQPIDSPQSDIVSSIKDKNQSEDSRSMSILCSFLANEILIVA